MEEPVSLATIQWPTKCPCGSLLCQRPYLPTLVMCARCKRVAHREDGFLSESFVPNMWTCGAGGCSPWDTRGIPYSDDDRYKKPRAPRWKDWREYR